MRCLSTEAIFDLLRAGPGSDPEGHASTHLASCARCARVRQWLEEIVEATAAGPLVEPPAPLLERAFEVMPERAPVRGRRLHGWALPTLVLDTVLQPAPAGVRSGSAAGRRRLYRVDGAELDLEIREEVSGGPAYRVTGQLLVPGGVPPTELLAVLWSDGEVVARAAGDPVGVFVLPRIQPGSYRLEVWEPQEPRVVRIEPLELGEGE